MAETAPWLRFEQEDEASVLRAGGDWSLPHLAALDRRAQLVRAEIMGGKHASAQASKETRPRPTSEIRLDLDGVERLDTAGGWVLVRTANEIEKDGRRLSWEGLDPVHAALLERIRQTRPKPQDPKQERNALVRALEGLGTATIAVLSEAAQMLTFFGAIITALARTLLQPQRLRLATMISHLEHTGVNAVPIVGLLSFLVGVVLAYQGAYQLRQFGAEIFTVDLLAFSVMRELGILITAIIVAGRSGSAFTAQIGTMKVNEEVDAMKVIGLDPLEVLVLPRLIALVIALPLLAFLSIVMALFGGGLVAVFGLDIPTAQFLRQLRDAAGLESFVLGMVKAPFFAFLIAMVGCYEGLKVEGSAESVGRLTTQAVVVSIFLVIVVDAIFSIIFSLMGY